MQNRPVDHNILKSRPHFEVLDGLRGLAALVVVVFHFMEIIITDFSKNFIAHGFLAVDFFFCLSGFVIAYAYDKRMPEMKPLTFIKLRLIRLQPLVVVGSILGLLTFLYAPFGDNLSAIYGLKQTALIFLASLFVIPYPVVEERYFNLFNLNAPCWSLFWEYIANLVYLAVLFRIGKKILYILVVLAAIGIFYVARNYGTLIGGWSGETFFHGLARIAFSFLMGMLIFRSNLIIKNKLGLLGMSVLLMLAFLSPYGEQWNHLLEPFILVIYFPLLVSLGAGTKLTGTLRKINKFSGDISYPLYMVHYPFMWVFANYVAAENPSNTELWWVISISTILLIALAYAVFRFIDFPLRRYLRNSMKL